MEPPVTRPSPQVWTAATGWSRVGTVTGPPCGARRVRRDSPGPPSRVTARREPRGRWRPSDAAAVHGRPPRGPAAARAVPGRATAAGHGSPGFPPAAPPYDTPRRAPSARTIPRREGSYRTWARPYGARVRPASARPADRWGRAAARWAARRERALARWAVRQAPGGTRPGGPSPARHPQLVQPGGPDQLPAGGRLPCGGHPVVVRLDVQASVVVRRVPTDGAAHRQRRPFSGEARPADGLTSSFRRSKREFCEGLSSSGFPWR